MNSVEKYNDLADRLHRAYSEGPVDPLRDGLEPTDVEGAYAVQSLNTERWLSEGRQISGWKIGLTAKAVQQQLGVDQPDFGVLYSDMAVDQDSQLEMSSLIQPKGEAEIALVLKEDVERADVTAEEIARAVDYVVPAIEIVDSRIKDWKITFADTVADNGSSAKYILGGDKKPIEGLDLYSCGMVLEVDGAVSSIGAGAACLGHPLNAAAWLAQALISRGQALKSGHVILTGALGPMVNLEPGQSVKAIVGGLGDVAFTCGAK